jgi:transmembrane sensor
MKNRFNELFQRFKNDTATQREIEELGRMLISGEYDELIREDIGHAILEVIRHGKPEQRDNVRPVEEIILNPARRSEGRQREVIPLYRRTGFRVAASLAVLLVLALWFTTDRRQQEAPQETVAADFTIKKERVMLPDGSVVYLNTGSKITYGDDFGMDDREVVLKGEGFFDVKHNAAKPFKVQSSGGVEIRVLGTAFNVNAQPGKKDVTVTVARGLVAVGHGHDVFGKIRPNQEIVVDTSTFRYKINEVNAKEAIQWTENFLLLDNVTLSQAVGILEDRYGVKFIFSNPALANCEIRGTFLNNEELPEVLDDICNIRYWKHELKGNTVIINGEGCY